MIQSVCGIFHIRSQLSTCVIEPNCSDSGLLEHVRIEKQPAGTIQGNQRNREDDKDTYIGFFSLVEACF